MCRQFLKAVAVCLMLSPFTVCATAGKSLLYLPKIPSLQGEAASPSKAAIKPPLVMNRFTVLIDAGHGGHDIGTQSISKPRYLEKSLNLVTAKFVKHLLQERGYRVEMTREDDRFVSLDKRAKIANEMQPALFLSIHYNSAPSAEADGIEVYFYQNKEDKERVAKSKRLAQIVLKHLLQETKANSRGVKHGNFLVIRETTVPAILVEGGFVTNEKELEKLKDPLYLRKIASGIAKGIEEYLHPRYISEAQLAEKQK